MLFHTFWALDYIRVVNSNIICIFLLKIVFGSVIFIFFLGQLGGRPGRIEAELVECSRQRQSRESDKEVIRDLAGRLESRSKQV